MNDYKVFVSGVLIAQISWPDVRLMQGSTAVVCIKCRMLSLLIALMSWLLFTVWFGHRCLYTACVQTIFLKILELFSLS